MAPKFNPNVFETVNPDETTLDKDGFVGVDPIYQNFANSTDKPLGDAHKDAEKAHPDQAEKSGDDEKSEPKTEASKSADDGKSEPKAPASKSGSSK